MQIKSFNNDRYVTVAELGRGGMGIVYQCTDTQLLRDVAVKVLSWSMNTNDAVRFHKEAVALGKMQHPNILRILDFGQSEGDSLFIVMELLSGQSLSDIIDARDELSLDQKLSIFLQLCDGLIHAHAREILHRDIKPSNIFVDRTAGGELKATITDFGLAKLLTEDQRLTKTGISIGSPPYMSPEQANGQGVDERSDIYSLGCLMFEVLTGRPPFLGETVPQTLLLHINGSVPKLADKADGQTFSAAMENIIAKCLAKEPQKRYQTVEALRVDLRNYRQTLVPEEQIEIENSGVYRPAQNLLASITETVPKEGASSQNVTLAISAVVLVSLGLFGWFVAETLKDRPTNDFQIKDGNEVLQVIKADPGIERVLSDKDPWKDARGPDGRKKLQKIREDALAEDKSMNLLPTYIDCSGSEVNDDDLRSIAFIPIKGLRLNDTKVTDKGLETLKEEGSLKEIYLNNTRITDDGLRQLARVPHLMYITLDGTAVTDKTIKFLSSFPDISTITLHNCKKVKGETINSLARPTVYTRLSFSNTNVLRRNIPKLYGVDVEELDLAALNLTDDDLDEVSKIKHLRALSLNDNPAVTERGLFKFANVLTLDTIYLNHCNRVTDANLEEFYRIKAGKRCNLYRSSP